MENTIDNNQRQIQDNKTQKTTSILEKVHWGLWVVYGLVVGYSFWYFRSNSDKYYFDDSFWLGIVMITVLTLVALTYGYIEKINFRKKHLFTHWISIIVILQIIVSFFLVYFDCRNQGFCEIISGYIGLLNGGLLLIFITVILVCINYLTRFIEKR